MGKYADTAQKRNHKKSWIIVLCILAVMLAATVAAAVWVVGHYHIINAKLYAKDLETLDLRDQKISEEDYGTFSEKLPDCEIRWNIPFQGGLLPDDSREVTVTTLSEQDVEQLDYAKNLKVVHAEDCRDYEVLELLRQRRPELDVRYDVVLSAGRFARDVETLLLNQVAQEDIPLLKYLPCLKSVVLETGNYDPQTVAALQEAVHNAGWEFGITVNGKVLPDTETKLKLSKATESDLDMLQYLPQLQKLTLVNPKAAPEKLSQLRESMESVEVSWQVKIGDKTFKDTAKKVDLTMVEVTDLAEVEQKLAYLPKLKSVTFGLCGVDNPEWGNSRSELVASPLKNEDLAAYRDRVRGNYKVVWTVRLGPSIALRTDADNFMPNHFGVGQLPDSYAYNLRYCEDMVALDVGHMTLTDISFVEFMPKLKYLILAWTEVQYIEPIRTCKNLVFLELDNSCIRDLSPLVGCTALEDLNLGNTFCDVTPILEMDWLKNVYFIDGSRSSAYKFSQAVPTARVVATGNATVGGGWRRLQNYYDMRDCLNMPYMN